MHRVLCSVRDNAGNTGSGSDSVKIDTANPTVTVSQTVNGTNGWNTNAPVTGNVTHPVVCSVSDNAGNTGSGSDSVKIDTANPTVTVSHTVNGTNGWNTNAPVTLNETTAVTVTCGLAGAPTCTVDGSAATVS